MQITYTPKKILYFLGAVISLLVLAHIAGLIALHYFGHTTSYYTIEYFNLAGEQNFPTFFSSVQLFCCAVVLAVIGNIRKKQGAGDYWHWLGLSAVMLFLSADEALMIHEIISIKVRNNLNTSGVFHFAWIIPYSLLVLVVGVAYIPFLLKLPAAVKKLMILAGFIFVSGALGLEAAESFYYTQTGVKDLNFAIMVTIEETMEMVGILIFLYSLLYYIEYTLGGISIRISAKAEKAVAVTDRKKNRQPILAAKLRVKKAID